MAAPNSFINRWSRQQIVLLGVVLFCSSILSVIYLDQKVTQWFHNYFQGKLDPSARVVTFFGLGDAYFLISVCGYILSLIFIKRMKRETGQTRLHRAKVHFEYMFLCFMVSGVMVTFLKFLFGRCRPYHSPDFFGMNFQPFNGDWDFQSYPSGHTQVGFTLATFLATLFPRGTKYFYFIAAFIGLSRVVLEKHFLGDVIAGAYVGILGTYLTWHWRGKFVLKN